MLDYVSLLFNCLCGSNFDDHDYVQPRFATEVRKLNEFSKKRDLTYFNQLKKTFDQYRLLYHQPSLDSLGFAKNVKQDFTLLSELSSQSSGLGLGRDKKKLLELCQQALLLHFPLVTIEQIVGNAVNLEEIDEKKAEQRFFSYVNLHNTDCIICHETFIKADFLGKTIFRTPCDHFMHKECFKQWKVNCPVCRAAVDQYQSEHRWDSYLWKINDKVKAHFEKLNDPTPPGAEEAQNSKVSDQELALALHRAELAAVQDRSQQIASDAEYAQRVASSEDPSS